MKKNAVIAIGGNSLIRDKKHCRVEDQYLAITETSRHVAEIIEAGYNVVVTHGNGAQVGFILRRSEVAYEHVGLHIVPLVSCVADTQGAIGYQIQQALSNEFRKRGIKKKAITVVTQVLVNKNDPGFSKPSKPIGTFHTKKAAKELKKHHPDWILVDDAGRGMRRVVPSPKPIKIIEQNAIENLLKKNYCVIAAGGGGIPVIEKEKNIYEGIDAVIDKDYASALLASNLNAELLIISTGVDRICLNFGKPDEKPLNKINISQAKKYMKEGHFAAGSMLPKIKAIISFLENGGKKAIITKPENLKRALLGKCGTSIVK